MLVTVDRAGAIVVVAARVASAALGRPLGRTAAAASVSASADGRRLAFTRDDGAVAVLDVAAGAELYRLRFAALGARDAHAAFGRAARSSSRKAAPSSSRGSCRRSP